MVTPPFIFFLRDAKETSPVMEEKISEHKNVKL